MTQHRKALKTIGAENETLVLDALHRYGHLRVIDLARLFWHARSYNAGYVMAHRVLNRLEQKRYCLRRYNSYNQPVFVLAKRGVDRLAELGVLAQNGVGISGFTVSSTLHRAMCNIYLIERETAGAEVISEVSMFQGFSPFTRDELFKHYGRMPDGLVLHEMTNGLKLVDWIEVENAHKPHDERVRILKLATAVGRPVCGNPNYLFNSLCLVAPRMKNTAAKFKKTFRLMFKDKSEAEQVSLASTISYTHLVLDGRLGLEKMVVHGFDSMLNLDTPEDDADDDESAMHDD